MHARALRRLTFPAVEAISFVSQSLDKNVSKVGADFESFSLFSSCKVTIRSFVLNRLGENETAGEALGC